MTDGIIPEIIRFAEEHDLNYQWIEQELIDKIKQQLKQIEYRDDWGLWSYPEEIQNERSRISRWLIGDNKE